MRQGSGECAEAMSAVDDVRDPVAGVSQNARVGMRAT